MSVRYACLYCNKSNSIDFEGPNYVGKRAFYDRLSSKIININTRLRFDFTMAAERNR